MLCLCIFAQLIVVDVDFVYPVPNIYPLGRCIGPCATARLSTSQSHNHYLIIFYFYSFSKFNEHMDIPIVAIFHRVLRLSKL